MSRNIYMYMPRRNATVGVGGAYQNKTTFGNEPVTAATVLLAGLHKVGGGYHSGWTSVSGSQQNTSLLIGMPATQVTSNSGEWQDGSGYMDRVFCTDSGYSNTEGDGAIHLKDVVVMLRAVVGGWNVSVVDVNADVNKDGIVDLRDAVLLHRYIVGGWGVVLQ